MVIFNLQIFGSDAEQWLNLSKLQKKEWILKYTNQKDESAIDEFIQSPKITKGVHCIDCRNKKEKINIAEIVKSENENATSDVPIKVTLKKSRKK